MKVDLLIHSQHTKLPLYRGDIDEVLGVLHLRKVLEPLEHGELTKASLLENASEPYFVPAGTPLDTQLRNFQRQRQRIGLVVDEYGDVDGLVTRTCSRRSSASSPPTRRPTAPTCILRTTAPIWSTAPPMCASSIAPCAGSCRPMGRRR